MTAWKTRPRLAVSSSAPRSEPSSLASASVSGVNPEMSAKTAAPATRSGISRCVESAQRRSRAMYASGSSRSTSAAGWTSDVIARPSSQLSATMSMTGRCAPVHSVPMTGRVFRRSLDPDLPIAVEAHGSTIRDAAGREYLDAAGGAIVVNVGHGRASIARVLGEQLGRLAYAHGSTFTTRAARGLRGGDRAAAAGPRSGHLPGQRRLRGDRDRAEAQPRLPPRPWRDGPLDRDLPVGELSRQHARGARPVRASATPPAVRGLARPVPPRLDALSVPGRRARCARARVGRGAGRRAGADDRRRRTGHRRCVRRRADRRGDARGRRPARRLLAADRGGLPTARRAPRRGRGDDRVRPDGRVVRARITGA